MQFREFLDLIDTRAPRSLDVHIIMDNYRTHSTIRPAPGSGVGALFSFLFDPADDATNWSAEHAIRCAVITRKLCGGGNRTTRGAVTQYVFASVLRTAR